MYGRGIMAKKDFTLKTLCNERVGDGVYKMVLKAGEDIGEIMGGSSYISPFPTKLIF